MIVVVVHIQIGGTPECHRAFAVQCDGEILCALERIALRKQRSVLWSELDQERSRREPGRVDKTWIEKIAAHHQETGKCGEAIVCDKTLSMSKKLRRREAPKDAMLVNRGTKNWLTCEELAFPIRCACTRAFRWAYHGRLDVV